MRIWMPVLLAAATGAACAGRNGAGQDTNPAAVVDDLRIQGTEALSERDIKKRILTSETPWWPFARKRYFDPVEWQSDLERIERLYQTRGYYRAQIVRSDVQVRPGAGLGKHPEVDLLVEVVENQPVRVGELRFEGLDALPATERETVEADLAVQERDVFRESAWEQIKSQVTRRLRDLGYAHAQVTGKAAVDLGTQQAELAILTAPGPRYRFGDVRVDVRGSATPIDPTWVREQVELALEGSEVYSDEALDEAQRRVFAMGVFSTVRVDTGQDWEDGADGRLPVVASVRAAPTHSVRLGGGLGFDQIRQEARVIAEWTDRNFQGGLRRLQARGMAGWAFLPTTIAVLRNQIEKGPRNGAIYRAALDFQQPRLTGRPSLQLSTLIESERTLEETYTALGGRTMAGVRWEPHSTFTLFPAYNLQGYWLEGPRTITPQSAPLTLGCTEDPCFVLLSYLEQIVTWDTRDDPLLPRKGRFLSLSLQEGGGPLGGGFNYLRVLPEARGYYSLGEDDRITLAARLRVGSLINSGRPQDSAVVTRFYSGGSNWMRGFSMRRLSPLALIPTPNSRDPASMVALPIGGNGLIEGNFEVRSRFSENMVVAAFLDYGSVTRERLPLGNLRRVNWAAGFGFRYLTPVGPLRADLGFRLPFGQPPPLFDENDVEISYQKGPGGSFLPVPPTGNPINRSCFGIGGDAGALWVRDGLCSFHISIGEAF